MRREPHSIKESLHRTKGWVDGLSYGLLAEEWNAGPNGQTLQQNAAERQENAADHEAGEAITAE